MVNDTWEVPDRALKAVRAVARRIAVSTRGVMDHDELVSVGYEWIARHKAKTLEWSQEPGGYLALSKSLYRAMQRAVQVERLARTGAEPQDLFYYSPGLVEEALPLLWGDRTFTQETVEDDAPRRRKSQPNEGNNQAALIADLDRAVGRLPGDLVAMLQARYVSELTFVEIGRIYGLSEQAVTRRLAAAVQSIVDLLGGESPHRRRPRLSNAGAQAEVRNMYEGGEP